MVGIAPYVWTVKRPSPPLRFKFWDFVGERFLLALKYGRSGRLSAAGDVSVSLLDQKPTSSIPINRPVSLTGLLIPILNNIFIYLQPALRPGKLLVPAPS
jgi:hypothetical protein